MLPSRGGSSAAVGGNALVIGSRTLRCGTYRGWISRGVLICADDAAAQIADSGGTPGRPDQRSCAATRWRVHTDDVSEELVEAAKAAAELEPAIEAFAEATGALGPVRESTGWLGDVIRVRREAHLAKVLMRAAQKIKASGLPPHAVRDKLLRAVVEDGSMEDDESMQERWASLLAREATRISGATPLAYARILSELEPREARLLDRIYDTAYLPVLSDPENGELDWNVPIDRLGDHAGPTDLDSLVRLGLVRLLQSMTNYPGSISDVDAVLVGVRLTALGADFVETCRTHSPLLADQIRANVVLRDDASSVE